MKQHFDQRGIHYQIDGQGAPVLFINSLGTDLRLWDRVLPPGVQAIRYDLPGHGQSRVQGPFGMGDLVADAAALLDHLGVRDALVVGCSIGGMVAQGLAAERHDLVRAMVLTTTAAKIGTEAMWADRIAAIRSGGIEAIADAVIDRWFSRSFADRAPWRAMLTRTTVDGYVGCCEAIAGTDLFDSTARLRLPTLAIAGSEDGSTPPDMVRETADLIPGSRFELIRRAGHLPSVEAPEKFAALIQEFIKGVGHV